MIQQILKNIGYNPKSDYSIGRMKRELQEICGHQLFFLNKGRAASSRWTISTDSLNWY